MALITISNDIGSGGKTIAQKVADELELDFYHDNRLMEKALQMDIEDRYTLGLKEKSPGFFDRLLGKNPEIYMDVLQAVVYEIARQGTGVIFGHGSQVLLKDFSCALHVRIIASEESRVENVVARRSVSREDAMQVMRQKDEEFKRFFSFTFHRDFNDPSLYDLIINTDKIGFDQAAHQIIQLAQSNEIKACSLTALDAMKRRSLERVIHAELIKQEVDVRAINISVEENEIAVLSGIAQHKDDKEIILRTTQAIPGITDTRDNLIFLSDLSSG